MGREEGTFSLKKCMHYVAAYEDADGDKAVLGGLKERRLATIKRTGKVQSQFQAQFLFFL